MKKCFFIVFILIIIFSCASCSFDMRNISNKNFIHTDGQKLVDSNGAEYKIHGMNFGNKMWYNPSLPVYEHHNEESYKTLKSAGINTIRYYLNYAILEDDANPYTYKNTGVAWLDQNVQWAENNGIKIIFNMHVPQGAKDADSWDVWNSIYMFTGDDFQENQNRLVKMWEFIASRYKNSTAVLGYGLLNEPNLPYINNSINDSIAVWKDYAQTLADAIRKHDKNHILFVEPATKVTDTTLMEYVTYDYNDALFLIDDDNFAVEYHYYHPMNFTHQASNTGYAVGSAVYPDLNKVTVTNATWKDNLWYNSSYNNEIGAFQEVSSTTKITSLDNYNAGCVILQTSGLGSEGIAYFDDVKIEAWDENNIYKGIVQEYNFNTQNDFYFIQSYYGEDVQYNDTLGIENSGCISVQSPSSASRDVGQDNEYKFFTLQKDFTYKITGNVKILNSATASVRPTIAFYQAESINKVDKEYLRGLIEPYIEYGNANNIPMYMGEFGVFEGTYNYGGYTWISDMLDLLLEYNLDFSYHEYHKGMITGYVGEEGTSTNEIFYNLFKNKLSSTNSI